jgi:hypothetical protein
MDKFLLAENPMRPDDKSGPFIIHMLDPIAIIRCTPGHDHISKIFKQYQLMNGDQLEEWTLSIYHLFTADMLEKPEDRALKLLDRAWRWYRAFLEWEYKNIADD